MAPKLKKARHHLDLLDKARCEGNWEAVPEIVRKVRKHAANRACLALTAEVEQGIIKANQSQGPNNSASGHVSSREVDLSAEFSKFPKLLNLIDEECTFAEDKFQAQVCVGWLHWIVGDYNIAFTRLPEGLDANEVESLDNISEWTRVCMLKSAYLRSNCLTLGGKNIEALDVFEAAIPPNSLAWTIQSSGKEQRYWSELLLTEYCMLSHQCYNKGELSLEAPNSLASFRSWVRWWDASNRASLGGGYGFRGSVPRRRVWFTYYEALSTILQKNLSYPTEYLPFAKHELSSRGQLYAELKTAGHSFGTLLLNETTFPRADEDREEVELFLKLLMRNWSILTGRGWNERDLGQGGRMELSAGVLEILYRASTKTFHSTAILRYLFTVHLTMAEFDLALKAFDSYIDIVKKARARVEKTGQKARSLDDDATILETICLCISALCRFGGLEAAEKAKDLASELEDWLERIDLPRTKESVTSVKGEGGRSSAIGGGVPAKVLALAWQYIGLAQAQWARMTFDSRSRTEIQRKAIQSLRKSLSPDYGGSADVRAVFALGLLLAEQRDLTTAIELIKTALLARTAGDEMMVLRNGPFWRERCLIPLWHLLSLLLSARQEYILAARTCECAFEQFRDPVVLFGRPSLYKSDHLKETDKEWVANQGLVDEMDEFEKANILEVKMSQLAIVEITEGPRVAVNASLELLTLFSRLFGSVQAKQSLEAPKTTKGRRASGTFRSIKSGIFGSRSSRVEKRDSSVMERVVDEKPVLSTQARPQTTQTEEANSRAPTIQVTQENGSLQGRRPRRKSTGGGKRSESAKRNKRDSQVIRRRAASTGPTPHAATVIDGEPFYTPVAAEGLQTSDFFSHAEMRHPLSRPSSALNTPGISRTVSQGSEWSARPQPADMSGIALEGIEPAGAILPVIQFDKEYKKRQRSAILTRVWLMVAGFYRRAGMHDDAKGAVNEAQKLVETMEADVGKDHGEAVNKSLGSLSLRDRGWAAQKSVEELWGDVWCENGQLQVARGDSESACRDFEAALAHFPDHPAAIVGLSNILLDLYCGKIVPSPAFPGLDLVGGSEAMPGTEQSTADIIRSRHGKKPESESPVPVPKEPLGLGRFTTPKRAVTKSAGTPKSPASPRHESQLEPAYKASSMLMVDRLAARDRAYGLLSRLTRLGTGWNYSEAWFTLARAHEESGQLDKAKEVLWWCVELEEGMGVRDWACVNAGGYVL